MSVPHFVHFREAAHVRKPHIRRQNLRPVRAGFRQQSVDFCKDLPGLFPDGRLRVVGDLAREIDRPSMDDELAHARPHVKAFNRQGASCI
jgi:hypothetical protein